MVISGLLQDAQNITVRSKELLENSIPTQFQCVNSLQTFLVKSKVDSSYALDEHIPLRVYFQHFFSPIAKLLIGNVMEYSKPGE